MVAGTHGKTTSTAMMAHVLDHAGRDPSMLVGGVARDFGRQLPARHRPRLRDRGGRIRHGLFRQGPQVSALPRRRRDHHRRGIRPCGYLPRPRSRGVVVPRAEPRSSIPSACSLSRRISRTRRRSTAGTRARRLTFGLQRRANSARPISGSARDGARFAITREAPCSRRPLPAGRRPDERRQRARGLGAAQGIRPRRRRDRRGLASLSAGWRAARRSSARPAASRWSTTSRTIRPRSA